MLLPLGLDNLGEDDGLRDESHIPFNLSGQYTLAFLFFVVAHESSLSCVDFDPYGSSWVMR